MPIIEETHTNLTFLEANGKIKINNRRESNLMETSIDELYEGLSVKAIYDYALTVPLDDIIFILEAATLNRAASQEGLKHPYDLEVGRTLKESMDKGILCSGLENKAAVMGSRGISITSPRRGFNVSHKKSYPGLYY